MKPSEATNCKGNYLKTAHLNSLTYPSPDQIVVQIHHCLRICLFFERVHKQLCSPYTVSNVVTASSPIEFLVTSTVSFLFARTISQFAATTCSSYLMHNCG